MVELRATSDKIQILAPAGSEEQLVAAVNNGCDAVYLGLDSFNARMKAPNFTLDNLSKWVDYCHLFGVKTYVAINTSLKNEEFAKAVDLLLGAYKCNVDGVIVTDLALMRIAAKLPKPFEIVASTQLNVHDKYGAEFVKKCGATTVVCARECSFEEIREIASTGIGVECFLHGAMCVCQSGQCLFSSMVGGNSGNRGLCVQPCRKRYFAEDGSVNGYLLSAHDICSLDTAGKLAEVGATTFKIEGRNRRSEYAGLASRIYKQLFDNGCVADCGDYSLLAEMFNRGMSSNKYLYGSNADIVYPVAQNHTGVYVGTVKNGGVETVKELFKGDGLKVYDGNVEVCGGIVTSGGIGAVKAQFGGRVADGMRVFRTTCARLCNDVMSGKRKLNVSLFFSAKIGRKPIITAKCNQIEVSLVADFAVEKALKSLTDKTEITKQLQKSGETHYTISDTVIEIDDIFIAKSQINALRRDVLEKLTQQLINEYNKIFLPRRSYLSEVSANELLPTNLKKDFKKPALAVVCYSEKELKLAFKECDYLIYKTDNVDMEAFKIASAYDAYVDLPSFADLNYANKLLGIKGARIVCNNVGQVEFARQNNIEYVAGCGLNMFNDFIAAEFDDAQTFVYSRELTLKEIRDFENHGGLTVIDGQIPLMQLCHCPYKVVFNCDCSSCKADKELIYRDELGNRFAIKRRRAGRCLFELVNGNKLSAVNKLKTAGRYLIDFDEAIIKHYKNINKGIDDGYKEIRQYTKGRLYDKIN